MASLPPKTRQQQGDYGAEAATSKKSIFTLSQIHGAAHQIRNDEAQSEGR